MKISWKDAAVWGGLAGVLGGLAASLLSDAQADLAAHWAGVIKTAALCTASAAGAFAVAVLKGRR